MERDAQGAISRRGGVVMVVEHEPILAVSLREELSGAGYEIGGPFATCADAVAHLDRTRPTVAIISTGHGDIHCMPLIRGLQERQIPVLIHSGFLADDIPELRNLPWIAKPAAFGDVAQAVRALMEQTHPPGDP